MIVEFPSAQERRRRRSEQNRPAPATLRFPSAIAGAALAACHAELRAVERRAGMLAAPSCVRMLAHEKEKPRQGGTWGPGLEPRMGRAEARTVSANPSAYTVNSLCV